MNLSKAPPPTKLSASAALVKSMAGAATSAAALSKPSKPTIPAKEEDENEEDELNLSTQVPVSKGKGKPLPDTASKSDNEEGSDEDADEDVDKNRDNASAAGSIQDVCMHNLDFSPPLSSPTPASPPALPSLHVVKKAAISSSKPPPSLLIKPVFTTPPICAYGASTTDQGILREKATNQNMADIQEDTEEPLVMDQLVCIVKYSGTTSPIHRMERNRAKESRKKNG
ncbi:hypothetical protein BKA70DRAFT_1221644 [Coprinopsis sp. MPI-PUGE-AT-0042]|nr:hypothetical protein BKA70DRAFT_1221644 [Coprinopsis sp. MPI-PUGE-AT-0042]